MKYELIQKANETIKTTDIKGKQYAEVNQRIRVFRMLHPDGCISTELLSMSDGVCVFKATITDGMGIVLATGHAYEKEDSSFINKTSYIENCETSSVGRALGMCGIGIDTSVASAEEVLNAIKQQEEMKGLSDAQVKTLESCIPKHGQTVEKVCQVYNVKSLKELTVKDFMRLMNRMGEQ